MLCTLPVDLITATETTVSLRDCVLEVFSLFFFLPVPGASRRFDFVVRFCDSFVRYFFFPPHSHRYGSYGFCSWLDQLLNRGSGAWIGEIGNTRRTVVRAFRHPSWHSVIRFLAHQSSIADFRFPIHHERCHPFFSFARLPASSSRFVWWLLISL